jgi:hypothetical protein
MKKMININNKRKFLDTEKDEIIIWDNRTYDLTELYFCEKDKIPIIYKHYQSHYSKDTVGYFEEYIEIEVTNRIKLEKYLLENIGNKDIENFIKEKYRYLLEEE